MFRDRKPDSEHSPRFVWNQGGQPGTQGTDTTGGPTVPDDDTAAAVADAAGAGRGPRSAHHGRALVAAAVIVPLAGGGVGLLAYQHRHPATVATAEAAQVTPGPQAPLEQSTLAPATSLSPSPSPSPSRSRTASPSAVPTHVITVVKTVAAHAAPATTAKPRPVGAWSLNHSALDSTGTHDGTANEVSWDGGAAVFTGASASAITTSGPVLNTGSGDSFTVSASVFLTSYPTSPQVADTAVSQSGATDSAFYLQYFGPDHSWAFSRTSTDTDNPSAHRAISGSAQLDVWTHLVGVYNAANHTQYLYVNGKLQGTAKDTTPFASSGPLVIGRAWYDGGPADWFHGLITQVSVYEQALTASQVAALD